MVGVLGTEGSRLRFEVVELLSGRDTGVDDADTVGCVSIGSSWGCSWGGDADTSDIEEPLPSAIGAREDNVALFRPTDQSLALDTKKGFCSACIN